MGRPEWRFYPPTASYYLIGKLLNDQWSDDNKNGYELTTTDNKIYSYTVNNDKADNYDFRFRIGTNDNTKAKAYHPKDGTVETSGDHINGYKLNLSTEAEMEQSESDNYWYATLEARHSYTFTFDAENKTIQYKDNGDDGLGKAKDYELVFLTAQQKRCCRSASRVSVKSVIQICLILQTSQL